MTFRTQELLPAPRIILKSIFMDFNTSLFKTVPWMQSWFLITDFQDGLLYQNNLIDLVAKNSEITTTPCPKILQHFLSHSFRP